MDNNPYSCSENVYSSPAGRTSQDEASCSGKIIYDTWAYGISLGSHDILSGNKLEYTMKGLAEGTSHAGGAMVDRATMLVNLNHMGVPVGSHAIGAKYGHAGFTATGEDGALLKFTIDSNYASFSSVAYEKSDNPVDIYFCACIIGEDCPDHFT